MYRAQGMGDVFKHLIVAAITVLLVGVDTYGFQIFPTSKVYFIGFYSFTVAIQAMKILFVKNQVFALYIYPTAPHCNIYLSICKRVLYFRVGP